MDYLDLTFDTPEHNLACDEALLQFCEEGGYESEIIRLWEAPTYFVVLGYSNKIKEEIHQRACEFQNIPVLRRPSGGGTVLQGPGCLNYSLILNVHNHSELSSINKTNAFILEKNLTAINTLVESPAEIQGVSDLTHQNLKFSGNAQRRKKNFLLFHGTILFNFNIPLITAFIKMPPREPDYRGQRNHEDFLKNIPVPVENIKDALFKVWNAPNPLKNVPMSTIDNLVQEKYTQQAWNYKF